MEVLISMIIFMLIIGMSSQYISTASYYPFISYPIEPWLNYIEDVSLSYQRVPGDSIFLSPGSFIDPFPNIVKPTSLNQVEMLITVHPLLPGLLVAQFQATSSHEKKYHWRSYKIRP